MTRPWRVTTSERPTLSRRAALSALAAAPLALAACTDRAGDAPDAPAPPDPDLPPPIPRADRDAFDALCNLLLPTEPDAEGAGAIEARADEILRVDTFVPLAVAQGLLPSLPDAFVRTVERAGPDLRAALNVTLDALASSERPLARFVDLPAALKEAIVARAFDDAAQAPAFLVVRAACFTAWLGATTNDLGLRAVGFPPFEDWDDRLACSGYPRTDPKTGEVDDYTYDRAPPPTPDDDLTLVLDANGDLP